MFFRILIFAVIAPATVWMLANYLRELFVFFWRREDYEALDKPSITHGEGGGPEVSTEDRLMFSYPLFIVGFGGFSVWLGLRIIVADMQFLNH